MTRVTLYGGACPCRARKFKAKPPADMHKGSPFGENLRALVIYPRFAPPGRAFSRFSFLSVAGGFDELRDVLSGR